MVTPPYEEVRLIWNEGIAAMPDVVVENIHDYYTYTPVDLYFNRVPEGSAEHVYYAVGVRNTVLDLPTLQSIWKAWRREKWALSFSKANTTAITGTMRSGKP